MKVFNITTSEKYTKDGVEKTKWNNIGVLVQKDDGKQFIKLHMFPDQFFGVFEQKPKEDRKSGQDAVNWDE